MLVIPPGLSEEEEALQKKFNKLKKKKTALLALKKQSSSGTASQGGVKRSLSEQPVVDTATATEQAKQLVKSGAISAIKAETKNSGFKRSRTLEGKLKEPERGLSPPSSHSRGACLLTRTYRSHPDIPRGNLCMKALCLLVIGFRNWDKMEKKQRPLGLVTAHLEALTGAMKNMAVPDPQSPLPEAAAGTEVMIRAEIGTGQRARQRPGSRQRTEQRQRQRPGSGQRQRAGSRQGPGAGAGSRPRGPFPQVKLIPRTEGPSEGEHFVCVWRGHDAHPPLRGLLSLWKYHRPLHGPTQKLPSSPTRRWSLQFRPLLSSMGPRWNICSSKST